MSPIQQHIINLLVSGENLRSIGRLKGETMPGYREIVLWLYSKEEVHKEFQEEYYRIQKLRAHLVMEDVMDVVITIPDHKIENPKGPGTIIDPGFLQEAKFRLSHMRTMLCRFDKLTAMHRNSIIVSNNGGIASAAKQSATHTAGASLSEAETRATLNKGSLQTPGPLESACAEPVEAFPEIFFCPPLEGFNDNEIEQFPEYEEENDVAPDFQNLPDLENLNQETSSSDRDTFHSLSSTIPVLTVPIVPKALELYPTVDAVDESKENNLTIKQCNNSTNNITIHPKKLLLSKISTFKNGKGGWQDLGIQTFNSS